MSIISLQGITKCFGDHCLFRNYYLDVEENDFIALIGKSGAGKSTLLNIIGLLEKQDSGNIYICGKKNPSLDRKDGIHLLRYDISYLFQNYGLVENISVEDNIKIGLRYSDVIKRKNMSTVISEALQRVNLSGYEKKKVFQLSGGEQQRVALARLLVKPSSIVLADEPTGSLDAYNRDIVMKLLVELNVEGKTIIMVTHDNVVANYAKKIIEL